MSHLSNISTELNLLNIGNGFENSSLNGVPRADSISSKKTHTQGTKRSDSKGALQKACLRCGKWTWQNEGFCDGCGFDRYLDWNDQKCDFCQSPDHELAYCPDPKRPKACHLCGHGHLRSECTVVKMRGQPDIHPFLPQFTPSKYKAYRKSMWKAANSHLAERPKPGTKPNPGEKTQPLGNLISNTNVTTVTTNFVRVDRSYGSELNLFKYKIRLQMPGPTKNTFNTKLVDRKQGLSGKKSTGSRDSFWQLEETPDLNTRRAIIMGLLRTNPPDVIFATDYNSVIISVGELYRKGLQSLDNDKFYIKQHRCVLKTKTQTVTTKIEFVGLVKINNLIDYPELESCSASFSPTQIAAALKVIISQDIDHPFSRSKVNNQTAPAIPRGNLHQAVKISENGDSSLLSVRASQDSLLLNVKCQIHGTRDPQQKYEEIAQYVDKHFGQRKGETKFLNAFGLKIDQTLLPLKGRILEAPNLKANLKKIAVSKILPIISLQQPLNPKNQKVEPHVLESEMKGIADLFKKLNKSGLDNLQYEYQVVKLPDTDVFTESCKKSIIQNLNEAIRKMKSKAPTTVIIVLPKYDLDVYSCIKYWGDCIRGVQTVCLLRKNLNGSDEKKMGKFVKSLSAKVLSKLGSFNHTVETRENFKAMTTDTMIVGAYLSRGPKSTLPSIAGIVASCDSSAESYLASARLQSGNHEYIEDLESMIKERLLVWFKKNDRQLPTRILLYRGGVSDGQFGMLKCEEVDQIKKGFDAAIDVLTQKHQFSHMFKGKTSLDLKVTVVSVVRHQHTRFYSMTETVKKNTRPGVHNAPPGLVIDSTIVSGDNFNFYLQSHTTPMGTSKSAHYTVIENGMDFSESELQKLTYDLCFADSQVLYRKGNPACDRKGDTQVKDGMSTCMPARYAEYLCDRARCYIRPAFLQEPDKKKITSKILDAYAHAREIWFQGSDLERQNPWEKNLDDTMFYL